MNREYKIPNKKTAEVIRDAREGKNIYKVSIDELKVEYEEYSCKESDSISKIGFISSSFVEDSEDYSKW